MTATRVLVAAILTATAALTTSCAGSDTPDVAAPAAADTTRPDPAAYLTDVRHNTTLQRPVWNRAILVDLGHQICANADRPGFNLATLYDTVGVTTPDRDRVTTAARTHLCPT